MNARTFQVLAACLIGLSLFHPLPSPGQSAPQFSAFKYQTNREMSLTLNASNSQLFRIETTTDLTNWQGMVTLVSTGANPHLDTASPYQPLRFYRAQQLFTTNLVTGDHLPTADGDVIIHPINHATFVMQWKDLLIYCDPVGGATPFQGLPRAGLVLLTHDHGDHWNSGTLDAVKTATTVILAPQRVYTAMSTAQRSQTTIMTNGAVSTVLGITVTAVPAYNTTSTFHTRGVGNGYVLTIGDRRIYIGGDTQDTPEMRALQNINVAFLPLNLPYTMTIAEAVSAVREFRPKVVYPYHYRNQDQSYANLNAFKQQVGTDLGIEVRQRKWY